MFLGHQSCGSCKEGIKGIHYLKIVSEHDQEIPQSQTADKPMAPRGRAAQTIKKQQEDKLSLPHQDDSKTRMDIK